MCGQISSDPCSTPRDTADHLYTAMQSQKAVSSHFTSRHADTVFLALESSTADHLTTAAGVLGTRH